MKQHVLLCLALLSTHLAGAAPQTPDTAATVLAEDDFSSPQLSPVWTWLREDKAGWRLAEGTLSIRTEGLLWGRENSQRNVLLYESMADPQKAMAAEITVDAGLTLTHAYEHGGLICYFDDDHWVTLTQLNHVQDKTQKIMLVHETGGQGQDQSSKAVPYKAEKVELRLERRGSEFTGYFRTPGAATWEQLGTIEFEHSGKTPRFGVVAGQGDDSNLHWVEFDNFRILSLP